MTFVYMSLLLVSDGRLVIHDPQEHHEDVIFSTEHIDSYNNKYGPFLPHQETRTGYLDLEVPFLILA